jgi:hypothetical protein
VGGLRPRDPVDIAGPRPLAGVVVRPLNFTVRCRTFHVVEAFQVSSRLALWRAGVFPLPFLAMMGYVTWRAFAYPEALVVQGLPLTAPTWTKWIVVLVLDCAVAYLAWGMFRLKDIVLVGDKILVRSLFRQVELPLSMVVDAEWVQKPVEDYSPLAELVLREPSELGERLRFEPRSPEALDYLISQVRAASNNRGRGP